MPTGDGWDYVRYIPPWMDPDWQDEGQQRERTDFKISDLFDRLRPALNPKDSYKRPTKYAERFSIFPGRLDGRSRTSPTRAASRQLFPTNGDIKTGKDLFDSLNYTAAQKDMTIDEYMASARPDMQRGTETDQWLMQQYENLIIDENWQSILFGNLSMDEIHAEKYLTFEDVYFEGLSGPIDTLLERHMWEDTTDFGKDAQTPRYVYNLNGMREELDPKTNDRVWDAIQPALQLTTRMLHTNHPFTTSMQDITNRYKVPGHLYQYRVGQDPWEVKFKAKPDPHPLDPAHLMNARRLQNVQFSARAISRRTLKRVLTLRLESAFYSTGKFEDHCIARTTFLNGISDKNSPIQITIDAELVWMILSDKYSKSERMMASLVLASTLAHEMMHAWVDAAAKWLKHPRSFGITNSEDIDACKGLYSELCPYGNWPLEPYYNDDPYNEVGHAFEHHILTVDVEQVLGGAYWGFINSNEAYSRPRLLQSSAPMITRCLWPTGDFNAPPHLAAPHIRLEQLSHFIRIDDVRPFFDQDFWDISVRKYGSAALRKPSDRPHKINYNPASLKVRRDMWTAANLGSADKDWVRKEFLGWLLEKKKNVLYAYFSALVQDVIEFGSLMWRLEHDSIGWSERDAKWQELQQEVTMLCYEYAGFTVMTGAHLTPDDIVNLQMTDLYQSWELARRHLGRCPDAESTICEGKGQDFWCAQMLVTTRDGYEERVVRKLIDLMRYLMDECASLESLVCEFHQLPLSYWTAYRQRFPNGAHRIVTRAKRMANGLADLLTAMDLAEFSMPAWDNEWEGKIVDLGARFTNVGQLMALNPLKFSKDWRNMVPSMPMLRTSSRKRHQVWYFLAKKEMLSMEGEVLDKVREFKNRYQGMLYLGGSKIILPEYDPDEIAVAQRWAGTLDDSTGQSNPLAGPSTGIFDTQGVSNLVSRLQQQAQQAEDDKLRRAEASGQSPTLQQTAESQTMQAPFIPPKVQQMGMVTQTAAFGNVQVPPQSSFASYQSPSAGSAFAPYQSPSAGSAFPSHTPGDPSAWVADNSADLAQQVNQPLGPIRTLGDVPGTSLAGYGILPHPYAVRETVTDDLNNTAQTTFQYNDPSSFAQDAPRRGGTSRGYRQGAGPLGDLDQMWEQQRPNTGGQAADQDEDSDIEMTDAYRARVVIDVSSDDLSSSASDDYDRSEREGSESTSVESWSEDEVKDGPLDGSQSETALADSREKPEEEEKTLSLWSVYLGSEFGRGAKLEMSGL
ncbi:hypothetical protein CEP54_005366 [Fusarium duplospermum]|uniref:Uncharacterized protein n=1 Tax=Fusarium duplospermum TaxID=1325734 RepID=A0A428QCR2_9HYPO|nr:hypothetical protein CEP54_005366 [Fusarium duplospermum]